MEDLRGPPRRLDDRGPTCRGLAIDAAGAMLGPVLPLVEKRGRHFEAIDARETGRLLREVFDYHGDLLEGFVQCAAPEFHHWYQIGPTKKQWEVPLSPDPAARPALAKWIGKGISYQDIPHVPIPELGFSVGASNGVIGTKFVGMSAKFSSTASGPRPNSIMLDTEPYEASNADMFALATFKPALISLVEAWDPPWAAAWQAGVVDPWLVSDQLPQYFAGWIVYLARHLRLRISPPASAIREEMPGGGLLLIATEERFDIDNPAHVKVADEIQQALAPIQHLRYR